MHAHAARALLVCCFCFVVGACSDASVPPPGAPPEPDRARDASTTGEGDGSDTTDAGASQDAAKGPSNLRVVAANLSSGAASTYDSGEGVRLLQGLHPDVALMQEVLYGDGSPDVLRGFVTAAFSAEHTYVREDGVQIPNAIVSRYPIQSSGRWVDPKVENRGFVYAKIAVPGSHPLWAVSVHFLTTGGADRAAEAAALAKELQGVVSPGDYVVVGGDLNTDNRSEPCLATLEALVDTTGASPADQDGNDSTNAPRNKPYDWVLASPGLVARQVPTVVGQSIFPNGLVLDSRVYAPLAEVAPVLATDSAAVNMQHMPVVRDFHLPP